VSEQTVSIKFIDGASQAVRLSRLHDLCARLVGEGVLTRAHAHAVFPDDPDPTMAALFTVDVTGNAAAALARFSRMNGVGWVQKAGERRTLIARLASKERRLRSA
jgi:hypothetical protein